MPDASAMSGHRKSGKERALDLEDAFRGRHPEGHPDVLGRVSGQPVIDQRGTEGLCRTGRSRGRGAPSGNASLERALAMAMASPTDFYLGGEVEIGPGEFLERSAWTFTTT